MTVDDRLNAVIAHVLCVDRSRLLPGARFAEDLNADSLDVVQLVMAIEEEFGVEIDDAAAEALVTVHDATVLLDRLCAAAAGEPARERADG